MSAEHQASPKETFDVQAMGCGNTAPAVLHSALAEWLYHERMIYVFQWFGEWILFVEEWETSGTTSICQHNPNPWKAVKGLLFTVASAKCFRAYFARKSRDSRRQNERTLLVLCASVSVNGVNSNVKDGNLYIPGDSVLSGMDYYGKVFMKDNVRRE